jgi:hypothetical protein
MGDSRATWTQTKMRSPGLTRLKGRVAVDIPAPRKIAPRSAVSCVIVVDDAKMLETDGFRDPRLGRVDYCYFLTASHHAEISENYAAGAFVEKIFHAALQSEGDFLAILDFATNRLGSDDTEIALCHLGLPTFKPRVAETVRRIVT